MRARDFINEETLGTNPKRPSRKGSRPERGHEPQKRYKDKPDYKNAMHDMFGGSAEELTKNLKIKEADVELDERGKASRKLCLSRKSDDDLGASQLASCKSQGLRRRDGEKSHKLGKTAASRVKMGGKKIKGKKYGGPLPDWGDHK